MSLPKREDISPATRLLVPLPRRGGTSPSARSLVPLPWREDISPPARLLVPLARRPVAGAAAVAGRHLARRPVAGAAAAAGRHLARHRERNLGRAPLCTEHAGLAARCPGLAPLCAQEGHRGRRAALAVRCSAHAMTTVDASLAAGLVVVVAEDAAGHIRARRFFVATPISGGLAAAQELERAPDRRIAGRCASAPWTRSGGARGITEALAANESAGRSVWPTPMLGGIWYFSRPHHFLAGGAAEM